MFKLVLYLFLCCVFVRVHSDSFRGTYCPNGWSAYEGSCYLFADYLRVDWMVATQYCTSHANSNIAVLESKGEEMFLRDHAGRLFKHDRDDEFFWIGATDDEIEGEWIWYTTRQRVADGYNNWYPGQPVRGDNFQNCACLWGPLDFTWHDYHCTLRGHVICEKKYLFSQA